MNKIVNETYELIKKTDLLPPKVSEVERLFHLFEVARRDLSLAKLAEAHWDALSILHEASHDIKKEQLYGVWASEIPNKPLILDRTNSQWVLNGTKMFCSGAGIVDRALITAEGWLIDVNLTSPSPTHLNISNDQWITSAFKETNTSSLTFINYPVFKENIIAEKGWYLQRKGFWKGSFGPAACWGGGSAGLIDYARSNSRKDPHTLAHLAAMETNLWTIHCVLECAGKEIQSNLNSLSLQQLALKSRHIIEQLCTDILRRFARTYGPFPLACEPSIHKRYHELDLFLRQNHGERDLETLGSLIKAQ